MRKLDIKQAELAIGAILADLEQSTGQHVEMIKIENVEVTTMASMRQEFNRRVDITLKPIPGSHWEQG